MKSEEILKNNCIICNCEIDYYHSFIDKRNGKKYYQKNRSPKKYCSHQCSGYSLRKINESATKKIIKCIICKQDATGQKYCKSCANKIIKENGIKRSRIRNNNISIAMKLIRNILIHMSGGCCKQCKNKSKNSLAFHHINPNDKLFSLDISSMKRRSIESILEESYKCVLLCHNCHSDLHQSERDKNIKDSYRLHKKKYVNRKLKYISQKGGKCNHCNKIFDINNIQSACFHHTKDKIFDLCSIALIRKSDIELDSEVKKCILLCLNCHMELHNNKNSS